MFNLFKRKPARPPTEDEARYASAAQGEIQLAITSLLAVAERGCCIQKSSKKILELAELLENEAQINHDLIIEFLTNQEQI